MARLNIHCKHMHRKMINYMKTNTRYERIFLGNTYYVINEEGLPSTIAQLYKTL